MILIINLLILVVFSSLIYLFSLDGDFVFDDSEAILKNGDVNLNTSIFKIFRHDFWGADMTSNLSHKSYRPLTILTFRFNKYLSNNELIPFHFKLTNLIVHVIVSVLFYIVVAIIVTANEQKANKSLTTMEEKEIKSNENNSKEITIGTNKVNLKIHSVATWKNIPFISALLFSVHPIHVEAVSGIVGRADLLAALFYFSSIILYDKSISRGRKKGSNNLVLKTHFGVLKRYVCLMFSMVCVSLAVLSKELGITALGICCVYDIVIINKILPKHVITFTKQFFKHDNIQDADKLLLNTGKRKNENIHRQLIDNHTDFIIRQLVVVICLATMLYSRWSVMDFKSPLFQETDNPASFSQHILTRIATYNYLYFINILLMIWPQWLCFDWSMGCVPLISKFTDYRIVFVLIMWTFLIGIAYTIFNFELRAKYKRLIILACSLLVVPFLPASNLVVPVGFVVAERVLYIPSAGYCLMIAIGLTNLLKQSPYQYKRLIKVSFVALIVILALRTIERSFEWTSERLLFSSALPVCPLNAKVHYNVGKSAGDRGLVGEAEASYAQAIRLHPKYFQAMNNLANLLKDQERFTEAEQLLKEALKIKTDFPAAWMNLGIVLANLRQPEAAEKAYLEALRYRKKYADCHYNLGNLYLDQNKHELALKAWFEATRINPKHIVAWSNTLALLDNSGQIERALQLAPLALATLPEVAAIHFNVANLMGKKGDFVTAENHFKKAISLKENSPPGVYYANLGVLYHRWKKPLQAVEMYKRALKVDPTLKSAKDNLKTLTKETNDS